jgi:uncharacterized membrane protein
MNVLESLWHSFWWVIPLLLMILCCLGMRRRRKTGICGFRSWGTDSRNILPTDSANDILDKRYARGEIGREEYEERKRSIRHRME